MKENKKMLSELTGMLSIVVEAVLHSSTHTAMWVNKRKENSSSEKVGEVWEGNGLEGGAWVMTDR